MMKWIVPALLFLLLTGCATGTQDPVSEPTNTPSSTPVVTTITAQEAKSMMDEATDAIILDVRDQAEYDEGHIENAILIPYTQLADRAATELTDKDALILVYCRSGRRSAIAAQTLADQGYTQVYDFGGILDWSYEIVN